MNGNVLSIDVNIYHVQVKAMVNMVEMMDPMVHFREMMSWYAKLCRNPIMLGGE